MDNEKKEDETEIFQQALGDATHKPTENWEEELTVEQAEQAGKAGKAGKALSTWLPVDNVSRIFMLCFFLIGFLGFFTSYEWLVWSFLIAGIFSPRLMGEITLKLGQMNKHK
jgi:hypothetical protein